MLVPRKKQHKGRDQGDSEYSEIDFMLIDLAPLTRPTPTIAPTMVEEVDTGNPISENRCIPKAEAIYAVNAPGISSGVIPLPTVSATFLP